MANNAYDLAKMLADAASGPSIYVVPDNQQQQQQPMPREQVRYGEEVPRQSWQQSTAALVDAIGDYRKANPVKIPLPAGTKTLQAKQFEEEKRRFDMEWPYQEQSYQYSLNKPYYSPSTGGGGGDNFTEISVSSQLAPYLAQYKTYNDLISDLPRIAPHISADDYSELQKMVEDVKGLYFDEYDTPITPRDFSPDQSSPLFRGLEELGIYTRPKKAPGSEVVTDDDLREFLK